MVLGRFAAVRLGLVSELGLPQPERIPLEESTNERLQNRGFYKCPSLSEVKGTETDAQG